MKFVIDYRLFVLCMFWLLTRLVCVWVILVFSVSMVLVLVLVFLLFVCLSRVVI